MNNCALSASYRFLFLSGVQPLCKQQLPLFPLGDQLLATMKFRPFVGPNKNLPPTPPNWKAVFPRMLPARQTLPVYPAS